MDRDAELNRLIYSYSRAYLRNELWYVIARDHHGVNTDRLRDRIDLLNAAIALTILVLALRMLFNIMN